MPTDEQHPASLLRSAARLIETSGHCKGHYHDSDGRMCVYGALYSASDAAAGAVVPLVSTKAVEVAVDFLRKVIGTGYVVRWNDDGGRTEREVVDALDRAAELADAG